jgi:hypothetical protein
VLEDGGPPAGEEQDARPAAWCAARLAGT